MKIRRPFRAAMYVAVIVAAVGYVVLSAFRQPAWGDWTVVGRLAANIAGKPAPRKPIYNGRQLFTVRVDGEWTFLGPHAIAPSSDGSSDGVVNVHFYNQPVRAGLWHLLVEEHRDSVLFKVMNDDQPPPDHQTRLEILAAAEVGYPGLAPLSKRDFHAAGGGSTRRILWLGVLGDLSILAAFAAIIFSLVKLRREMRWRKPGCCTKCDYDLTGLTTGKCPECGAVIQQGNTRV